MLTEYKLNPADFAGKNVSALPDRPGEAGMTAAQRRRGNRFAYKRTD